MQTGVFSLLLVLNFLKVKFVCKKSVPIDGVDDQDKQSEQAYDNLMNTEDNLTSNSGGKKEWNQKGSHLALILTLLTV